MGLANNDTEMISPWQINDMGLANNDTEMISPWQIMIRK